MTFNQFSSAFQDWPLISTSAIRLRFPEFDPRRLYEWQKKGWITKIRRGHYRVGSGVLTSDLERMFVANRLYTPSYVSLESALSWYGLIPEGVFTTTSVSTRNPKQFDTPSGTFTYRTIHARMYFGYQAIAQAQFSVLMAHPEKALIDFVWLNPGLQKEDVLALRLNAEAFHESCDAQRFASYLDALKSSAIEQRIQLLFQAVDYAIT